jgi:lactoylglutathione lyase
MWPISGGRSRSTPPWATRWSGASPRDRIRAPDHAEAPDDDFVTIELVHDPTNDAADLGAGLNHFVIKVESMHATITELAAKGIDTEAPESPDGSDDFLTSWITDPDGNRIELVQWPAGHPDGITAVDWPEA